MNLQNYISAVQQYVFEEWIDVPLEFEYMVDIVSTHFFKNEIPMKKACLFAQLIIDIHTKEEFDFVFEYEPFNDLDDNLSEDYQYEYNPNVQFENFEIIIDGEKRIDFHYQEELTFKDMKERIKKWDTPLN